MNKEIQDKLDEFITSFLEVKEVKQFLILKDELASSKEIENLKHEVRTLLLCFNDGSWRNTNLPCHQEENGTNSITSYGVWGNFG